MQTGVNSPPLFDSLKCPITHQLFQDPVMGCDGHTYERKTIILWIEKHGTSPITREPMDINSLRPNYIVKKMVDEFLSLSSQKQFHFRLDVDVRKSKQRPIFQSNTKAIYAARWMLQHGPPIILIIINGAKANREASFYVQLSCHPHIVRTYGLVDNDSTDSIMLVQEYAPEGDLRELLRSTNFLPTFEVLLEIFWQIVDAMICLADNQIVHGDLACRNVLVFRSSPSQSTEILVKLTDFGLTRASPLFSVLDSSASSTSTTNLIPIRYAAPEILVKTSSTSYSEKSDVYSFGVLMWEACSGGAIPFGDLKTSDDVFHERLKGKSLERTCKFADEFWDIIMSCTQQEPSKRPSFKDIQEALICLKFQNRQENSKRISQQRVNNTAEQETKKISQSNNHPQKTNQYQYYNSEPSSQDNNCDRSNKLNFYQNCDKYANEYRFSYSNNADSPPNEYYLPCEYCLQSINTDDVDTHKEVCSIRRIVVSFVKIFTRLPPLEIVSCSYCEYIIPLNMIYIHKSTCYQDSTCLHNTSPTSSEKLSTENYGNSTYLKPISLPHPQLQQNFRVNEKSTNQQTRKPSSDVIIQSEKSNESSSSHTSTDTKSNKRLKSRSGFRKTLSKFVHHKD